MLCDKSPPCRDFCPEGSSAITMVIMDEIKPPGSESKKDNIALTPKDKADIRDAISQCATPEEVRELREWMAKYFSEIYGGR